MGFGERLVEIYEHAPVGAERIRTAGRTDSHLGIEDMFAV